MARAYYDRLPLVHWFCLRFHRVGWSVGRSVSKLMTANSAQQSNQSWLSTICMDTPVTRWVVSQCDDNNNNNDDDDSNNINLIFSICLSHTRPIRLHFPVSFVWRRTTEIRWFIMRYATNDFSLAKRKHRVDAISDPSVRAPPTDEYELWDRWRKANWN